MALVKKPLAPGGRRDRSSEHRPNRGLRRGAHDCGLSPRPARLPTQLLAVASRGCGEPAGERHGLRAPSLAPELRQAGAADALARETETEAARSCPGPAGAQPLARPAAEPGLPAPDGLGSSLGSCGGPPSFQWGRSPAPPGR